MARPYSTPELINESLGGGNALALLSSRDGAEINLDVVNQAISDADGLIESYANGTKGFPWTTNPIQAERCSIDIACHYISIRVWRNSDDFLERYESAIAELERLRDGDSIWVSGDTPLNKDIGFYSFGPNDDLGIGERLVSRCSHKKDFDLL